MKASIGLLLIFAGFGLGYLVLTGKLGNVSGNTSNNSSNNNNSPGTSTPVQPTGNNNTPIPLTASLIGGTTGKGGGLINPPVNQKYYPGSQMYF